MNIEIKQLSEEVLSKMTFNQLREYRKSLCEEKYLLGRTLCKPNKLDDSWNFGDHLITMCRIRNEIERVNEKMKLFS